MRRVVLTTALLALFATASASADFPPPGHHSIKPKYWPAAKLHVVNYSPYDYSTRINSMLEDRNGNGIWFTEGATVERIRADGSMQIFRASADDWLWTAYSLTYDRRGRLWFSLGQSGRIGTLDSAGHLRTRILVPRRDFPDIRDIAFASDGSLWFSDVGRNSIGRRYPDGTTREVPVPNLSRQYPRAWPVHLTLCGERAYVAANSAGDSYVFRVSSDLATFVPVSIQHRTRWANIACDHQGRLWLSDADSGREDVTAGTIDAAGRTRTWSPDIEGADMKPDPVEGMWFFSNGDMRLEHLSANGRVERRLDVPAHSMYVEDLLFTRSGTIWAGTGFPESIVEMTP